MAWNTPGSENGDRAKTPRGPRRGFGPGDLVARLRSLVDGTGGPRRWIPFLVGIVFVFSCLVVVGAQEQGVVLRFGRFAGTLSPGTHLKAPWPIERVVTVDTGSARSFTDTVPVVTSDSSLVQLDVAVKYRVSDVHRFVLGGRDAESMFKDGVRTTVGELAGASTLDALAVSRAALAGTARTRLQRWLDAYRTGLTVTEFSLPRDPQPPEEARAAFDDVTAARQDRTRAIDEARADAARLVPQARGEALRMRAAAEADKSIAIDRAAGESERFSMLVEQYKVAPEVTRKRLWLETLEEVLRNNRTVIGDSRQQINVVMDAPASTTAQPTQKPLASAPGPAAASPAAGPLLPDVMPSVSATPAASGAAVEGGRQGRQPRSPRGAGEGR